MRFDVHQHLWPDRFLAALRERDSAPYLDGWTLHLAENAYAIDPAAHDVAARAAAATEDVVCVAPSAALGIDRLDPAEAARLSAAWIDGALELPAPFKVWATGVDPAGLEQALARGAVGLEIAAERLAAPGSFDALAPVLDLLDASGHALLVHPGPPPSEAGRADWWAPVVPYVTGLHAAWWAWADGGRDRFSDVPVCFAALAGLGPLHGERFRARGGVSSAVDPRTFVETSSYGTQAVDSVIRVLGIDVVCHGSDAPYAEPATLNLDGAALTAIGTRNPQRLLAAVLREEVPA